GAGGMTALQAVAQSSPDGHAIVIAPASVVTARTVQASASVDLKRDLTPVILLAQGPYVLVAAPSLPARSVAELAALARTRTLTFGSGGIGSFSHLAGEQFAQRIGVPLGHVPFASEVGVVASVANGNPNLTFV